MTSKDLLNETYDAVLVIMGLIGLSMVTKKFAGEKLTCANNLTEFGRLAAGVTASTMLVKYSRTKSGCPTTHLTKHDRYYKNVILGRNAYNKHVHFSTRRLPRGTTKGVQTRLPKRLSADVDTKQEPNINDSSGGQYFSNYFLQRLVLRARVSYLKCSTKTATPTR